MGLPSVCCGFISHGLVVLVHGSPMGLPWVSHGSPMGLPWVSHGSPVGLPWVSHGDPMTLPCRFQISQAMYIAQFFHSTNAGLKMLPCVSFRLAGIYCCRYLWENKRSFGTGKSPARVSAYKWQRFYYCRRDASACYRERAETCKYRNSSAT